MKTLPNNINPRVYTVLGVSALLVFILTLYVTPYGESIWYTYSWDDGHKITSLGSMIGAIINPYTQWTSGYTPNVLTHLFCNWFGRFIFAVCNAIVYVLLIVTMVRVSNGSRRSFHCELTMAILVLFMCDYAYIAPIQIATVWVAAMSVYMIRLINKYKYYDVVPKKWQLPLFFIYGVIVGCGNIYITYALAIALIVYAIRKRDVLQPAQICLLLGFAVGLVTLLSGRGFETAKDDILITAVSILKYSKATYVLIAIWIYSKIKREKDMDKFYKHHSLIANAFFASLFFNLILGVDSPDDLVGQEFFAAILAITITRNKCFTNIYLIGGTVLVCLLFFAKMSMIHIHNSAMADIKNQLRRPAPAGNLYKVVTDLPSPHWLYHPVNGPMFTDPERLQWMIDITLDQIDGRSYRKLREKKQLDQKNSVDMIILPKAVLRAVRSDISNKIIKCPGDVYLLMQVKNDPADFVINREYGVFKFVTDRDEVTLEFDDPRYSTRDYNIIVSSFLTPLTLSRDVALIQ